MFLGIFYSGECIMGYFIVESVQWDILQCRVCNGIFYSGECVMGYFTVKSV